MATLSYRRRKRLPKNKDNFVFPEKAPGPGSYPIPDIEHARNALARVAQHGSPQEQAEVKRVVYRKYPELDPKKKQKAQAKRAARRRLMRNRKGS